MIETIIFDFFGVFRTDGYNRWLDRHGYKREGIFLAVSEKHDRGEYSDREFAKALASASGETAEQVEKEFQAGNKLNQPLIDYVAVTLGGRYKLVLLSNSSSEYMRGELAKYDLEKYFDEIVISSEIGLIKPEFGIFEYTLRKINAKPHECIFIDDNPRHVRAAEKLGIHGVVFKDVAALKKRIEEVVANA